MPLLYKRFFKRFYFVLFFVIFFVLKNAYSKVESGDAVNSTPISILKQLEFTSDLKTTQFTIPLGPNRLKDVFGNVLQARSETISESDAKKILKNRLIQLKMLFEPQSAPYPGMITKNQNCRKSGNFAKKINTNNNSISWHSEMPGSDEFSYGSCGSRKEPYWSQYLLIYCKKQKTLYDIRYFLLLKNKNKLNLSHAIAKCKV